MKSSEELVQILAVGVGILEDERFGSSDNSQKFQAGPILSKVYRERRRQDDKWGPQHHTPEEWAMILIEEMGEWASEVVEENQSLSELALFILTRLHWLELEARDWLESHEWPEQQQEVFDQEKRV